MIKNITIAGMSLLLMMALCIGFVGCSDSDDENGGGSNGGGSSDISQSDLISKAMAAGDNMETCEFSMGVKMTMDGESMGESFSMAIDMNGNGVIDNINEEMEMVMDMGLRMDMGLMGDMDIDTEMEVYVIDNITYTKTGEMMGMPEQWTKMEIPGAWEQQDMVSQQTELLKAAQIEISDGGNVNGASCYKVEMTPNMRDFFEMMMQQQGVSDSLGGSALPADMDMEEIADMIKDFSVTQWYAKDTLFPMRAEMTMDIVMTPEMMDMPEEQGTMKMDMTTNMDFKNYNEAVSITLPAAANNAMDMSDMMDFDEDWDWE